MERARQCDSPWKRSCIEPEGCSNHKIINDLPNFLLQQILEKVNHPRWLRRCRLVCKLWRSLLPAGDPPFALIFNIRSPSCPPLYYVFKPQFFSDSPVFRRLNIKRSYLRIFSVVNESSDSDSSDSEDSDSESSEIEILNSLKLDYLLPRSSEGGYACVQASCRDLLLCAASFVSQRQFYLVNPWTRDWVSLPKTLTKRDHYVLPIGLVAKNHPLDLIGYHYKVVRLSDINLKSFEVEVFDPDIIGWREMCVSHPYGLSWRPTMLQAIVYEGALHWLAEYGPIVAYNPFAPADGDGKLWCRFIARSNAMKLSGDGNMVLKECITVSEGYIHIIQLITYPNMLECGDEAHNLTVWKLEDYEKGKWTLEHRVYFKDMVSDVLWLQQYVREFVTRRDRYEQAKCRELYLISSLFLKSFDYDGVSVPRPLTDGHEPKPLACHPSMAHVVYLYFPSSIVSCNMHSKMLRLVSSIHQQPMFHKFDMAVSISASAQATPVPKCSNQSAPDRH